MRVVLFAGTTEGRLLAGRLAELPLGLTVCVATEAGREALAGFEKQDRVSILVGRLDAAAMRELFRRTDCAAVVDATHPYAATVSGNIREAARAEGPRLIRVARAEGGRAADDYGAEYVEAAAAAARLLDGTDGAALLATGTKELDKFVTVRNYAERLYPRVLPTVESVARCIELGFSSARIIAMRGPFSRELNRALLRQFAIRVMVTKDGGSAGGFAEKMDAAKDAGVRVIVIARPPEETAGIDIDAAYRVITDMLADTFKNKFEDRPGDKPCG